MFLVSSPRIYRDCRESHGGDGCSHLIRSNEFCSGTREWSVLLVSGNISCRGEEHFPKAKEGNSNFYKTVFISLTFCKCWIQWAVWSAFASYIIQFSIYFPAYSVTLYWINPTHFNIESKTFTHTSSKAQQSHQIKSSRTTLHTLKRYQSRIYVRLFSSRSLNYSLGNWWEKTKQPTTPYLAILKRVIENSLLYRQLHGNLISSFCIILKTSQCDRGYSWHFVQHQILKPVLPDCFGHWGTKTLTSSPCKLMCWTC